MKKIYSVLAAAFLVAFSACDKSAETMGSSEKEVEKFSPIFTGTMGPLTRATAGEPDTRAGVIEDNPDYKEGEQFYWHNGDRVKMLFFKDGNIKSEPQELTYVAVVAEGVQSNKCTFSTTGSIAPGTYTVYGLYPADRWSKDETGYKATIISIYIYQNGTSSHHLGEGLFMKSKAENISVGLNGAENSLNAINMSFEHLSGVIRFRIKDPGQTQEGIQGGFIDLRDYTGGTSPGYDRWIPFFPSEAYLEGGIDGDKLIPGNRFDEMGIVTQLNDGLLFADNPDRAVDFYMPFIPTGLPADLVNHKITLEAQLIPNNIFTQFGTLENGLSFTDQLSFMPNGFEVGKSYYFNLTISPTPPPPPAPLLKSTTSRRRF